MSRGGYCAPRLCCRNTVPQRPYRVEPHHYNNKGIKAAGILRCRNTAVQRSLEARDKATRPASREGENPSRKGCPAGEPERKDARSVSREGCNAPGRCRNAQHPGTLQNNRQNTRRVSGTNRGREGRGADSNGDLYGCCCTCSCSRACPCSCPRSLCCDGRARVATLGA